ncbi:endonuclease III [Hamiltosporidium magnivora]|uniref:DNA-(apurinic or apyrimidinic site) lyase n=2 Tax=Hamiltosporidium TaxID=1176354 RepID=A0A4Q9KTT5_9MICR|nr:endonuclease III [Hamiltosporidium magnivora]
MQINNALHILEMIKEQRKSTTAPVDTMGCNVLARSKNKEIWRFQLLISLILSSQTKDEMTAKAMSFLFDGLLKKSEIVDNLYINKTSEDVLCIENIINTSFQDIAILIRCVGFHNKKAVYIKKTAEKIHSFGKMPDTLEMVCSLPGVGNKMAFLYLYYGFSKILGISVDTHVHRVFNRIGLVETKTPENTRKKLEKIYDKELWKDINKNVVGFGQVVCLPIKPKCKNCCLKNICKSSKYNF